MRTYIALGTCIAVLALGVGPAGAATLKPGYAIKPAPSLKGFDGVDGESRSYFKPAAIKGFDGVDGES